MMTQTQTPATPNTALQRTAALAFSYRRAGLTSTGSVTACAPATKPSTCRAFASRRYGHLRQLAGSQPAFLAASLPCFQPNPHA